MSLRVFNQLQLLLSRDKRKIRPRPSRMREPTRIEREYQRDLARMLEDLWEIYQTTLEPNLEKIVQAHDATMPITMRRDSPSDDLDELFRLIGVRFEERWNDDAIERLSLKYGLETSKHNREQLQRSLKRVVGVDVITPDLFLTERLSAFAVTNTHLIKSMCDEAINKMETTALVGLTGGDRAETIAKNIRSQINPRVGNIRARANLIARDQISKLNGQLNMLRQTELGIKRYVWRTSGDERVRDRHQELNGETFSWDKPPVINNQGDTGHPGDDYQCRCVAEPILEDVL